MSAVKKYDGSTWQPITPKKLKGVPYSGALPAVLTGTKAGYLHKYKVYGNSSSGQECGERTENLAWTGWAEDFVARVANASNAKLETIDGRNTVYFTANTGYGSYDTKYIFKTDWKENTVYTLSFEYFRQTAQTVASILAIKYTDGTTATLPQYQKGDWYKMTYSTAPNKTVKYLQAYYVSGNLNIDIDTFMVIEGSTAPTSYEPYGYKLPLTSGSTPIDIYIGGDTLSTDEYVDSGTGKIYRMVGGTLTPIDPPIPFPQIPTIAGSTTISWAGEGLAPSQFDSIQEWVDIPTYTYTNGAWVADT